MIKLSEHPLSPYAQKVKLALIEKGIPYETASPRLEELGALRDPRLRPRHGGALAEAMTARAGEQIAGLNAWLARALGDAPYFHGERFGWADLAIVPHVNAAAAVNGFPPPAGSALARCLDRVRERPSVTRVVAEALASMRGFEMLPRLVAAGTFVREYRDHRLEWLLRSGGTEIVLDGMAKKTLRFSTEIA